MGALSWLMNLGFAGGAVTVVTPALSVAVSLDSRAADTATLDGAAAGAETLDSRAAESHTISI